MNQAVTNQNVKSSVVVNPNYKKNDALDKNLDYMLNKCFLMEEKCECRYILITSRKACGLKNLQEQIKLKNLFHNYLVEIENCGQDVDHDHSDDYCHTKEEELLKWADDKVAKLASDSVREYRDRVWDRLSLTGIIAVYALVTTGMMDFDFPAVIGNIVGVVAIALIFYFNLPCHLEREASVVKQLTELLKAKLTSPKVANSN